MEVVLGSPGLSHIVQKILRSLDFKSLPSMRLVCKSANNQIEELAAKINFKDLQKLLGEFAEARSLTDAEKECWNNFLKQAFCNGSKWNPFMSLYLKHVLSRVTKYGSELKKSPILEFILYGNEAMVQFVLDKGLYQPEDLTSIIPTPAGLHWTLVHEADFLGHKEISERLKKFTLFALNEKYANSHNYGRFRTNVWDSDDEELVPCVPQNSSEKL